jgi:hypothetical protein
MATLPSTSAAPAAPTTTQAPVPSQAPPVATSGGS